jgi:type VI secretion system protein ImpJ
MSLRSRPLWFEGQLIRPQHLQQMARWTEALIDQRIGADSRHAWGVHSLRIDPSHLLLGRVSLLDITAVLPDGTPVQAPDWDHLPAPRAIAAETVGKLVKLAVPARAGDGAELDTSGQAQHAARYAARSQPARDTTGGAPTADLQVGMPALRLLLEGEPDDDLVCLPLARIAQVESSGAVTLDPSYVPPSSRLGANPAFPAFAREIQGMVAARAEALAARVDPTRTGTDIAGMLDIALLQLLNTHEPLFAQFSRQMEARPEALHTEALRLAGALATFTRETRRPAALPDWQHEDPWPPLAGLLAAIREALSRLVTESAVSLPLVARGPGTWVSVISDRDLLTSATFVLTARANTDPERLRAAFPPQAKVGPAEVIRDLVNLQLPGIELRPMPVAPRELPFRTGTVYLELERSGELWRRMQTSSAFVVHVGGDYPGLALEFWAIRAS